MFNYTNMVKRAIEFFPLWTDIRKRYKKSVGGNFLTSMIEVETKIEETIQEYIDSYFLYNYIGHEDEVMAFSYMTTIGILDTLNGVTVLYNDKLFPFVSKIKDFEELTGRVFYEEGRIYMRVEDYIEGIDTITIIYDNSESEYEITKVHIWNIFDEYATFVNTRRQENETNKQLVDRILYITNNLPNGTESGLKHAIISELMTDFPDITEDEIVIERPTPENLMKPYEDYETLLDMLAYVNRDVYRTKRWDLDFWEYNFESISYIPHIWNKVIKDWQNGVGSYNDLEVILSDESQSTDVEIYLYKKTLEAFQKYIYDKYIDTDIHFTMTRYNDILNKMNVKYKLTASELEEITYEDIRLKLYESKKQENEIAVQDLIVSWGKDIERIDNNIISDSYNYRLQFESKTGHDLVISRATVVYSHKDTGETMEVLDLMRQDQGFVWNSEYELVSEANKEMVNVVEHFTSSVNLVNHEEEGITIKEGKSTGSGVLSLTDRAGLYIDYDYDCDTVDIPSSLINTYGGYWDAENNYVVRGDYSTEVKTINFEINANYVAFDITDDSINARILLEVTDDNGTTEIDISELPFFETEKTLEPRHLKFTLKVLSEHDVKFKNFRYSNFSLVFSTKYGTLTEVKNNKLRLPNFYNNELTIDFAMKSGNSIVLKYLYIGEDFQNVSYLTDNIPVRENCIRHFEILTNGKINLLQYNSDGVLLKEEKGYDPVPSYRAISDNAYIRMNLSDYESIIRIQPDVGTIETIEESGVLYYHIRLKTNQTTKRVTILGIKTREAREVTLQDMVKCYVPDYNITYDKIYCSKCSKGLVISRQNPGGNPYNELINIKSDIFAGLKIVKYIMVLPSTFGTIYGSDNGYENRSNISVSSFDYISIYPAGSQIYQAVNEYDTYLSENKFINIANNFTPMLNTSKNLFYKVELYDKSMESQIKIGFHSIQTAEDNIDSYVDWSVGTSNTYIAIKNNIDLLNNAIYNMTTYDVNETNFLSTSIDIKDSYTITNYTILDTEKYIIETDNEQVEVKYDYYDGTSKKEHLLKHESIFIESDGFNKLIYSNIDTIYHCSIVPFDGEYKQDVNYELLNTQGIIVWKDIDLIEKNVKVYLVYSIKKPIAFTFNLEYLYKAIDYDVEAFAEIGQYKLLDKKNGESIDLKSTDVDADLRSDYRDCDLIYVSCTEPTFEAKLDKDVITFNKYIEENTVLIKTGYYYINGREYYLFSEDDTESIKNNAFYTSNNIDISGGEITTYKETNNYVYNSEMRLKGLSDLYSFNCSEELAYGVSRFNHLTSCESFNEWTTFHMSMKIVEGLNGLALQFTPATETGYAFIDITDSLVNDVTNYVSFYATDGLQVFVGRETYYQNIALNRVLNIRLESEIEYKNTDIRNVGINKKEDERYYLVVLNEGIIDDIVISTDPNSIYESHTKNISLIGFDLYEKKPEGTRYRMLLKDDKDYKPYHAALMSDGKIKTTSDLDWYVTELKTYTEDQDFKTCKLTNIGVNADSIYTNNDLGVLETPPINIGNTENIKRIFIKINDIELDAMSGFSSRVFTSKTENGDYVSACSVQYQNKFYINKKFLDRYIKLKIEMPARKYINNITVFVEYTSSNENPLPIITKQTGYIESKIYDLQEVTNCTVKAIDIEDVSNINDIEIYIRSSKDNERLDVWSNWRQIYINENFRIANSINFTNTRFLQYKIIVKNRNAYVKFNSIDIEIK